MTATGVQLEQLLDDLRAEQRQLDALVAPLHEGRWDVMTPAVGWAVRDQISHLAFFDENATLAITRPAAFRARADAAVAAAERGVDPMQEHLRRGRAMPPGDLLRWWRAARHGVLEAANTLTAEQRVEWYGPPMGARSFVSARLMETWAHGQDIVDALGLARRATDRLRHVAHLGVHSRPFSYAVRGLPAPDTPVMVELLAPSGARWTWGATREGNDTGEATVVADRVQGDAVDFCLVVTQRRHLLDTSLAVTGDGARQWMAIAQAFAGPPGPGRGPAADHPSEGDPSSVPSPR